MESEVARVAEGVVTASHMAVNDFPLNHESHDKNIYLKLDGAYEGMHSDANEVEDGVRVFEVEWESKHHTEQYWASVGDRAWVLGRWIFDCGHPPYRTEIHPPQGTAYTRSAPHIFRGDRIPSNTVKSFVLLNGKGGYYDAAVGGRDYEFEISVPPMPGSRRPRVTDVTAVGAATLRAEVVALPFGGPAPILTPVPGSNKVKVRYPLSRTPASANNKFGAIIAAGWRTSSDKASYRKLRVHLKSIKINNSHEGFPRGDGEWNLYISINGDWKKIKGLDGDEPGGNSVDEGDVRQIDRVVEVIVRDNQRLSFASTGWEDDADGGYKIIKNPSEADMIKNLGALIEADSGNDALGNFTRSYGLAENFGIGSHRDSSTRNGSADTDKDFTLEYTITEVARYKGGDFAQPAVSPN